ncbi:4019_t:CDS:2, partial [Cetraspora pellucida]
EALIHEEKAKISAYLLMNNIDDLFYTAPEVSCVKKYGQEANRDCNAVRPELPKYTKVTKRKPDIVDFPKSHFQKRFFLKMKFSKIKNSKFSPCGIYMSELIVKMTIQCCDTKVSQQPKAIKFKEKPDKCKETYISKEIDTKLISRLVKSRLAKAEQSQDHKLIIQQESFEEHLYLVKEMQIDNEICNESNGVNVYVVGGFGILWIRNPLKWISNPESTQVDFGSLKILNDNYLINQEYPFISRQVFNELIDKYLDKKSLARRRKTFISQTDYDLIITVLREPANPSLETPKDQYWIKNSFSCGSWELKQIQTLKSLLFLKTKMGQN